VGNFGIVLRQAIGSVIERYKREREEEMRKEQGAFGESS
jgi:hypothetical protein